MHPVGPIHPHPAGLLVKTHGKEVAGAIAAGGGKFQQIGPSGRGLQLQKELLPHKVDVVGRIRADLQQISDLQPQSGTERHQQQILPPGRAAEPEKPLMFPPYNWMRKG